MNCSGNSSGNIHNPREAAIVKKIYAILREEKLHNLTQVSRSEGHNLRTRPALNANPFGPPPRILWGLKGLAATVKSAIPVKRRKDAVIAVETVLTASPAFFEMTEIPVDQRERELHSWIRECLKFLFSEYGAENLQQVVLHLDEATPHIHATWTPMKDGRLSYSAISGSIKDMVRKQTDFALAMLPFGMVRGKENSKRKHEHHSKVVEQLASAQNRIKSASTALLAVSPHIHTIEGLNALKTCAERLFEPEQVPAKAVKGEESVSRRGPVDRPVPHPCGRF